MASFCGANKHDGTTCRNNAGAGTSHPGIGKCVHHFGGTPSHSMHAAQIEAKAILAEVPTFGNPVDIDPGTLLLLAVQRSAGLCAWLEIKVRSLGDELELIDDKGTQHLSVWVRALADERDRMARFAKLTLDAGLEERMARVSERQGEQVATLIRSVLGELGLTTEQQERVPALVHARLLEITAG